MDYEKLQASADGQCACFAMFASFSQLSFDPNHLHVSRNQYGQRFELSPKTWSESTFWCELSQCSYSPTQDLSSRGF